LTPHGSIDQVSIITFTVTFWFLNNLCGLNATLFIPNNLLIVYLYGDQFLTHLLFALCLNAVMLFTNRFSTVVTAMLGFTATW